jgi:tRNA-dihydrouridine synthase
VADADHMLAMTGCAGIAIGRGALLNPWFFAQLDRRERTGEMGPPPTYEQRLAFMDRHFHLLVEDRGQRFGCLTFRKVANWYCRVLRPGREVQQRLVRLESVAQFEEVLRGVQAKGPPRDWQSMAATAWQVAVPSGPIEHW